VLPHLLFYPKICLSDLHICTVVDQNKIGQSKFRLCNSIFLRNPSLKKQKCQKQKNNSDKCHHSTIFQKLTIIQLNKVTVAR
jgi:hypothetical protein